MQTSKQRGNIDRTNLIWHIYRKEFRVKQKYIIENIKGMVQAISPMAIIPTAIQYE